MLTETVAGRTYDYSHNVGRQAQTGMGFNFPVDLTLDADGVAYVINRGSETISNVGWNRTGVGQRVSKLTLGSQTGEEEFLGSSAGTVAVTVSLSGQRELPQTNKEISTLPTNG